MSYTPAEHWDRSYRSQVGRAQSGEVHEGDRWLHIWRGPLHAAGAQRVLDLGCGLGYDVRWLAHEGFEVTGLDYSEAAIQYAQSKEEPHTEFIVADMAEPLPFPDQRFDAVMSNVAAHMFSDMVTRAIFAEVGRIVRLGGLFLFHVNALGDRPLRAKLQRQTQLAENYVQQEDGHTLRFFSEAYLRKLLSGWQAIQLEHVAVWKQDATQRYTEMVTTEDQGTGESRSLRGQGFAPARCLWRGIIRR